MGKIICVGINGVTCMKCGSYTLYLGGLADPNIVGIMMMYVDGVVC